MANYSIFSNGKLPNSNQIDYGEVVVGYVANKEALAIKNSSNNIVGFSSDESIKNYIDQSVTDSKQGLLMYYSGIEADYSTLDPATKAKSVYFATDSNKIFFNNIEFGPSSGGIISTGEVTIKSLGFKDGDLVITYAGSKTALIPLYVKFNVITGNVKYFDDAQIYETFDDSTNLPYLIIDGYTDDDFNNTIVSSLSLIDTNNKIITLDNITIKDNVKFAYGTLIQDISNNITAYDVKYQIVKDNTVYKLIIENISSMADILKWST